MSREVDSRDFNVNKATPQRHDTLRSILGASGLMGGPKITIVEVDPLTGNPSDIEFDHVPSGLLGAGSFVQRALGLLQNVNLLIDSPINRPMRSGGGGEGGGPSGLGATSTLEFEPNPLEQQTSSGGVAVHLQQKHLGIPVFQGSQTVRFSPDGEPQGASGRTVTFERDHVAAVPRLGVEEAVMKASAHVAAPDESERDVVDQFGQPVRPTPVDLSGFQPRVISVFENTPEKLTVLGAGPFGAEIKASLTWFPLGEGPRLAWDVAHVMPNHEGQFRTVVDADSGDVLYCRQLMPGIAGRANVFVLNGAQPRQMVDFPVAITDYGQLVDLQKIAPIDQNRGFPRGWLGGGGQPDLAVGNYVDARLGENGQRLRGQQQQNVVVFNPSDATGDEQKILNIFFYCSLLSDLCYLLGFRERDGNFQQDNFNLQGLAGDPLDALAFSGPVFMTANFTTPVDGARPTMKMGLVTNVSPPRHTAFDATVVAHEFFHGVSNRLVGGAMNDRALAEPQSKGMGEGLSDYFACYVTGQTVVGSWVTNMPGGIRMFPYNNFPPEGNNFGSLGTGRFTGSEHNIGEIWAATLLELNRRVNPKLVIQLVFDAMKIVRANPSFLDMRNAILRALDDRLAANLATASEHAAARGGIWAAFAKFGMGPGARSAGASLAGIAADFSVPAQPTLPGTDTGTVPVIPPAVPVTAQTVRGQAAPALAVPDNNLDGVSSLINVDQSGLLQRIRVSVDIAHTYVGDLELALVAPSGDFVALQSKVGGNQRDLRTIYDSATHPGLRQLVGKPARGSWLLGVRDVIFKDAGRLNQWELELTLAGANRPSGLGPGATERYGFKNQTAEVVTP